MVKGLRNRRRGRIALCLLAALPVLAGAPAVVAEVQTPSAGGTEKMEPSVARALSAGGETDFWVFFGESADLSAAEAIPEWTARGQAVVDALRRTAETSQAGVRAQLDARKADYRPYHIVNTIKVEDGSADLAESLAARPEVAGILAPRSYEVPEPVEGEAKARVAGLEWGLTAINADDVWNTFGARGQGITVASIDSGVDFDHPALAGKYRGNKGGGAFDHNYNWFDPIGQCGAPSTAPCDNNGHGTHTMGTMVGDDGAGNQIGVAPGARWITAGGCCGWDGLIASGQWMLAPTDLTGANPRPDLRPHVVNNSWGLRNGADVDPYLKPVVRAWRAAGIFPAFSNGNYAPGCNTAGTPGDYDDTYSTGAFDSAGAIAPFSSRGPGEGGSTKPNVSAPGVDVRSAWPGTGYDVLSGTSMASPHVAGTVALLWSAAPALVGDLAATERLVDGTAADVSDLTCGGTAADNNVWGEGKLDAYKAVQQAPRGPTGVLTGVVTDSATGAPINGATVQVSGPHTRTVTTGADGRYTMRLPTGGYTVTASRFTHATSSASVTVNADQTTTRGFALAKLPSGTITGRVRDTTGAAVALATIEVLGTPIAPVTSAVDGYYSIPGVPNGQYQIRVSTGCHEARTQPVTVSGNLTLDFALTARRDQFGHTCVLETGGYVQGDTPLALVGDDASTPVTLPFDMRFYGSTYRAVNVSTNGHLDFLAPSTTRDNSALPSPNAPNAAVHPFWDDLLLDTSSQVLTRSTGTAPHREFVIEWRNAGFYRAAGRVDFEVVLAESGAISLRYRDLDAAQPRETGGSATVGIEKDADALQHSFDSPVLRSARSIRFRPPATPAGGGVAAEGPLGLRRSPTRTAASFEDKVAPGVRAAVAGGGETAFWVWLDDPADLGGAAELATRDEKAAHVHRVSTEHAARSQAGLRAALDEAGAEYTPFWIANTVKVTGDQALLDRVAARPEVRGVLADEPAMLPPAQPAAGSAGTGPTAVEWNIDTLGAPRVWSDYGARGGDIVVANIDTGVQWDHPALARAYRGATAGGADHAYNWFDPSAVCPTGQTCDNHGHGTHTMGTMVGSDGANQVGVAPGAKWIAAKGCEGDRCSDSALLASGQWVLAPTDPSGTNPRPDLGADVVNNSWGIDLADPWYNEVVRAWVAAGMFPVFAAGNVGSACGTAASPARYPESYAVGALRADGGITPFSARGAGEDGEVKPDIAAPGLNIRSSVPGGGYALKSGTSMAAPHVAGTVALLWSAAPSLRGDIAATRAVLDRTAVDVDDRSCGGTAQDNNVYGEGRLDAYGALSRALINRLGTATGLVTVNGDRVAGATVTAVNGSVRRTTITDDSGNYRFDQTLAGEYTMTVSKFGLLDASARQTVSPYTATWVPIAMQPAPASVITGVVSSATGPVVGAAVTAVGTPVTATTDATGRYRMTLPHGRYDLRMDPAGKCVGAVTAAVTLSADTTVDMRAVDRRDAFGHACRDGAGTHVPGTQLLALTGDDASARVDLPFPVRLYGQSHQTAWISTNGMLNFLGEYSRPTRPTLPSANTPNAALYPFSEDLYLDAASGVHTGVTGTAPHREFIVEWRDVMPYNDRAQRITFAIRIREDGTTTYTYPRLAATGPGSGATAVVAIENATGTDAFVYSASAPLRQGTEIRFIP